MRIESDERNSLVLLLTLLFFLVVGAFLRDDWISQTILVSCMYATLFVALMKVSAKPGVPWTALLVTCVSFAVGLVSIGHPAHLLQIANWLVLSGFFGYVSVALFSFLERPKEIIRAKLIACLGLYLILGMFFYAVFNLLQEIRPGSFAETLQERGSVSPHALLYFSFTTLTTVGMGDVAPVTQPARTIAALEAVAGVFYVAITVARLVAAYQERDRGNA